MAPSLLSLPSELRIEIFKYLLVQREPIVIRQRPFHELEPNILSTNKLFLVEGRPLLYGYNCFSFGPYSSDMALPHFIDVIGSINASHLWNIYIDFPNVCKIEDEVSLRDESLHMLKMIQEKCTNLQKLTTAAETTYEMEAKLESFDSPKLYDKALGLVAAHFRTIPSLQKVVVEVYEEGTSLDIRKKMENLGWIPEVVKPMEKAEWDFEWDMEERWSPDMLDDDDDDDYDDDYDIDNDSDFWRRAAD
ncbi:uncharacterized protein N7515_003901 [Penicillium bovifimosum]|uniref:Uncharacterized protein n=1 Tax=Penicillium bovifimosum TaxID=126998 RepID=A0A9W9H5R3_9EURO|nr:uncharacterized protein N7515_003901 [Penicillium bovifimosum]KAJ5139053.1 hypothetical protein N7515_003901 [Penicillium bovifimosum]